MRRSYDFSKGKRGAVVAATGKTRITIMLDDDVLAHFRGQAAASGTGYQTLINAALRQTLEPGAKTSGGQPVTVDELRRVLREELRA